MAARCPAPARSGTQQLVVAVRFVVRLVAPALRVTNAFMVEDQELSMQMVAAAAADYGFAEITSYK